MEGSSRERERDAPGNNVAGCRVYAKTSRKSSTAERDSATTKQLRAPANSDHEMNARDCKLASEGNSHRSTSSRE
jgi:hypothetical protein